MASSVSKIVLGFRFPVFGAMLVNVEGGALLQELVFLCGGLDTQEIVTEGQMR